MTGLCFNLMGETTTDNWVVSLGGNGNTLTTGNKGTSVGADVSVGRTSKLVFPVEVGIRQGVSYDGDATTSYTSKLYSDWTVLSLANGVVDVFAGGNAGVSYGKGAPTWVASPEAGVRLWVKQDVNVLLRAEFPFDLDRGRYNQGIQYFLGFQVKF